MKTLFTLFILLSSLVAKADPEAVHGMVVFGDEQTYVSHLPMFHPPHDYQFVAKVQMQSGPRSAAMEFYHHAKKDGVTLFTIAPHPMDLSALVSGKKDFFYATLYEGHFEKDGMALGLVEVTIEKTILAQKLVGVQYKPKKYQEYVLFGEKGEYYTAHIIGEAPNFDFIAKTAQPYTMIETRTGPQTKPVKDLTLPIVITDSFKIEINGQGSEIPQEGHLLGLQLPYVYQTNIIEIIYENTDELTLQ